MSALAGKGAKIRDCFKTLSYLHLTFLGVTFDDRFWFTKRHLGKEISLLWLEKELKVGTVSSVFG